jgi:hypothetical protein
VADAQLLLLFGAMAGFQAKHLLCDHVLQTRYQVANKGYYGRSGELRPAVTEGPPGWAIAASGIRAADDKRRRRRNPPAAAPFAARPVQPHARPRECANFRFYPAEIPAKKFLNEFLHLILGRRPMQCSGCIRRPMRATGISGK